MAALIGTRNEEELSLILCDGDECRQGILSPRRDFFKQKTEVRAPSPSPPHNHHSPPLLSVLSVLLRSPTPLPPSPSLSLSHFSQVNSPAGRQLQLLLPLWLRRLVDPLLGLLFDGKVRPDHHI